MNPFMTSQTIKKVCTMNFSIMCQTISNTGSNRSFKTRLMGRKPKMHLTKGKACSLLKNWLLETAAEHFVTKIILTMYV